MAPVLRNVCSHLAVFSVPMPKSSARTWAATADGARPTTVSLPCSVSHARRSVFIAVVFPAQAGPTSTSTTRPDRAIAVNAADWSGPSIRPSLSGLLVMVSMVSKATVGAVIFPARSRSRSSAASKPSEENTVEAEGRKRDVPSGRRNCAGLMASSGGVSLSDACSAVSTTMPVIALRSVVEANRNPMSCRDASACRFQRVHVDRFSPTMLVTVWPICLITSRDMSSARSVEGSIPLLVNALAQVVTSSPSSCVARCRHSTVRSARERMSLSGRVASVAWARSFNTVRGLGWCPCRAT